MTAILLSASCLLPDGADAAIRIELFAGTATNAVPHLRISQTGKADLEIDPRFETRALESPIYYALRVTGAGGWAIDLVHDKLFLANPNPAVARFSISHGLNLLSVLRIWDGRAFYRHIGLGLVAAHAESTVRGREFDEHRGLAGTGYHLTGPVLTLGTGCRVRIADRYWLTVEGRGTAARVRLPVAGGDARFSHFALHLLVGAGLRP